MKPSRLVRLVLLAAQCALLGGCTTSALWSEGTFTRYYEPACPPNLRLFQSPQTRDVLAQYDEACEANMRISPRAYWVGPNQDRITARQRPYFAANSATQGLLPVPISCSASNPPAAPENGLCVAVVTNNLGFVLYAQGREPLVCELPVYPGRTRRVLQVALTPLTVAADLTVVGSVIGYFCLECYANDPFRYGPYQPERSRR